MPVTVLLRSAAVVSIVGAVWLYRRGSGRLGPRGPSNAASALFAAGLGVVILTVAGPLDAAARLSLAAHMVQHFLLVFAAAALLAFARPGRVLLAGAPPVLGRAFTRAAGRVPHVRSEWDPPLWPVGAWCLATTVLWLWHWPPLYETALRSDAVHAAEHAGFLISAFAFWWMLAAAPAGAAYGAGVLYVFAAALQCGALGALMAFAPSPWYPSYAAGRPFGMTPMQDQQLAGLIMWLPGGLVYTGAGLALFAAWLRSSSVGPLARRRVA